MITILTEPSSQWTYKWPRRLKLLLKKNVLRRAALPYSGHFAVTRSLIEGLKKIGEPFIYNPKKEKQITGHVHVLAGFSTLQYAIHLKKKGKIRRLTVGPNIVVSSDDYNGIIGCNEIDMCLTPSPWVELFYLHNNPTLRDRIACYASGVDAAYWEIEKKPSNRLRLAFYNKTPDNILYKECKKIAESKGLNVVEIKYGAYQLAELKVLLTEVDFVVYFSKSESQGIVLAEIWATGTPTLVWNPGKYRHHEEIYPASSAPYLSSETGLFFKTADDFKQLFHNDQLQKQNFHPREWVLNNMTDEICAGKFLKTVLSQK